MEVTRCVGVKCVCVCMCVCDSKKQMLEKEELKGEFPQLGDQPVPHPASNPREVAVRAPGLVRPIL